LVDGVESVGGLNYMRTVLGWVETLPPAIGAYVTGYSVGVANNLVNNLPLGLLVGGTLNAARTPGLIRDAVLIGVDLGPNLSVTGSLATILWLLALRKEKLDVSFWDFLKFGAVAMPVAMFAAISGAILIQAFSHAR
jgi:arsenical pump membrane protein